MSTKIPPFLQLPEPERKSAVEALLFASEDSVSSNDAYKILILQDEKSSDRTQSDSNTTTIKQEVTASTIDSPVDGSDNDKPDDVEQTTVLETVDVESLVPTGIPSQKEFTAYFEEIISIINKELFETRRPYSIVKVSGGYQFATRAEHGELVARLVRSKSRRRLSQAGLETLAIIAYRQPISKPEIEAIRGVSVNEVVNTLLEKNLVTIVGRAETIGKPLLYGTTPDFLRAFGLHDITDLPKPRELEELIEERADILAKPAEIVYEEATDDYADTVQGQSVDSDEGVQETSENDLQSTIRAASAPILEVDNSEVADE